MSVPFARTAIELDVAGSTNDVASDLVLARVPELPLVVRAREQTQGRGRGENAWWSDAGSLTFTVAIDPVAHGLRPDHEPRLALATAVAVIDAVSARLGIDGLGIRWPNDIELGGRKLGGILPERVETAQGRRLVIGVGLNVLTRLDDAPPAVRRMAGSLAEASPQRLRADALDVLFAAILDRFGPIFTQLANDDPELAERWRRLDTLVGTEVRVDLGPRIVRGVGTGIDGEGALRLSADPEPLRLFGGRVLREA